MFNFFHSIIVKIAIGISSIALFFSGAAVNPAPQPIPQDTTSSTQIKVDTTIKAAPTPTPTNKKAGINTQQETPKNDAPKNEPAQQTVVAPKTSVITLPSGAIVEMDANGNIIRTIQAAPQTSNPPTYTAPTNNTDQTQSQINSIIAECNTQINQINQQIIDLKNSYYKQLPGILSSGTSVVAQGNANLLLNQTNQKIAQLDLQIQQIQLDCQSKISALQ